MREQELKALLRQVSSSAQPRHDCPDETKLAAYFEGGLCETEHQQLCSHFADCDYCLQRLGVLGRCTEVDSLDPVPELVAAKARRLASDSSATTRVVRRAPLWAAAAVLVLALGLSFNLRGPGSLPGRQPALSTPVAPAAPVRGTRFIKPLASGPVLLWPTEGESIWSVESEFHWTSVPGALYYDLRIVSDVGDLVWQERVTSSSWRPPEPLPLRPGGEYFVRVDAWVDDSGALSSDFVLFRYGGRD